MEIKEREVEYNFAACLAGVPRCPPAPIDCIFDMERFNYYKEMSKYDSIRSILLRIQLQLRKLNRQLTLVDIMEISIELCTKEKPELLDRFIEKVIGFSSGYAVDGLNLYYK